MATVAAFVTIALLFALREALWRRRLALLRQRLDEVRAHARESEQLASVGQLVSGLAQELKSPLQGVIGNTELMLATGSSSSDSSQELRDIQENATRAAGIVRNLLAFTDTTALQRRWQDVSGIIERAVAGCRAELDANGVRVVVKTAERLPLAYVDGRQLEKVVTAMLSQPAPRTGRRQDAAAILLATSLRGNTEDRLVIDVDDRGAGDIGDEATWSGDLAACRQIVEAHGGSLDVVRPTTGGCRFHLELPLISGAENESAPSVPF